MRIFRDKLVEKDAKKKFDQFLTNELTIISSNVQLKDKIDVNILNDVIFTSLNSGNNTLTELNSDDYYKELLIKGQMIYERDNDDLHMSYYDEVYQNCKIIDRIITKEFNNLLLIGT